MQQTAVLERGLDHPTPADDQLQDAGDHAAPVATAELVARARIGEQAAWDQLVERYGAMVWTVARGHDLGLEDAAEVSQVTWLQLTQHLGSLSQPDRLGVWLFTTASREALRMRRLRGAEGSLAAEHDRSDPWARDQLRSR
jgi:DNA-directed RNA polymerase specialized sigma24 family protein